ncbi:MAG: hypothetical protein ACK5MF_13520 [Vibrio sp.]|uniref:hypothetical protein n=1 Tax=Vibrio sp. TaxID=678 RepID=UPI003A875F60
MKTTLILCTALTLSACSSVSIKDGEQDAIVGNDRTQGGCHVAVDKHFQGTVTYKSTRCSVVIESDST